MAAGKKLKSILIRLVSSAGSGYFYATTKNPTNIQHKLALMKVRPRPVGRGDARAQRTKRRQREIMRAWRLRTRARPPPPRADASHTPAPPPRVCHRRPSACSLTRSSGNTCCSTRRRCPRAAAAAAPASRRAVACAAAARATRHAPITCMEEGTAHPPHPSHYPSPVWRVLLCVAPLEGLRCSSTHSARRQAARALWRRRGTRAGRPPPLLPGAERVAVAGGAPVSHRAPPPPTLQRRAWSAAPPPRPPRLGGSVATRCPPRLPRARPRVAAPAASSSTRRWRTRDGGCAPRAFARLLRLRRGCGCGSRAHGMQQRGSTAWELERRLEGRARVPTARVMGAVRAGRRGRRAARRAQPLVRKGCVPVRCQCAVVPLPTVSNEGAPPSHPDTGRPEVC